MRLIDADELTVDAQYTRSDGVTVYVPAVPCHYIKLAPTVDAIPRERIEQMIAEIQDVYIGYRHGYEVMNDVMLIIHKYTKEQTDD